MLDNDNEKLIEQIKDGLSHMEQSIPDRTPDLSHFRRMVAQVEEKKHEKKKKELILFIVSAIIVLCIETFTFSRSLVLFVVVQIAALISLPFSILAWKRHQSRQVKTQ